VPQIGLWQGTSLFDLLPYDCSQAGRWAGRQADNNQFVLVSKYTFLVSNAVFDVK